MYHNVVQQLKALKHKGVDPNPTWVAKNRVQLLAQISNTVSVNALSRRSFESVWVGLSAFLPRNLVYNFIRPVAVLLIVAMVGASSYIATVDAAYEAYPGDLIYPVSRAVQKTQVAVAGFFGGKKAETKTRVKIAQQLASKTQKIAKSSDPQKTRHLAVAVADLKTELAAVSTKLDEVNASGNNNFAATDIKDVKQNTERIKNVLQEVKNNLLISSSTQDKLLSQEISDTKNIAKDASIKAVEAMVVKHLEGDNSVSKDDVKQAISSTLQIAVTEAVNSKQNVSEIKIVVETAKNEVKGLTTAAASAGILNPSARQDAVITSTQSLSDKITNVANQTVRAVLKSEVVAAEVDKKATEAILLLNNNDLAKAVDKVKEVTDATKVAEEISDTVIEKAQQVLPAVQVVTDGGTALVVTTTKDILNPTSVLKGVDLLSSTPKIATGTVEVKK